MNMGQIQHMESYLTTNSYATGADPQANPKGVGYVLWMDTEDYDKSIRIKIHVSWYISAEQNVSIFAEKYKKFSAESQDLTNNSYTPSQLMEVLDPLTTSGSFAIINELNQDLFLNPRSKKYLGQASAGSPNYSYSPEEGILTIVDDKNDSYTYWAATYEQLNPYISKLRSMTSEGGVYSFNFGENDTTDIVAWLNLFDGGLLSAQDLFAEKTWELMAQDGNALVGNMVFETWIPKAARAMFKSLCYTQEVPPSYWVHYLSAPKSE